MNDSNKIDYSPDIVLAEGGYVYLPQNAGFLTSYHLRKIADILDDKNNELFDEMIINSEDRDNDH